MQGLFEYVKPKWQGKLRPVVKPDFDLKKFGATVAQRPTIANNKDKSEISCDGVTMPRYVRVKMGFELKDPQRGVLIYMDNGKS